MENGDSPQIPRKFFTSPQNPHKIENPRIFPATSSNSPIRGIPHILATLGLARDIRLSCGNQLPVLVSASTYLCTYRHCTYSYIRTLHLLDFQDITSTGHCTYRHYTYRTLRLLSNLYRICGVAEYQLPIMCNTFMCNVQDVQLIHRF